MASSTEDWITSIYWGGIGCATWTTLFPVQEGRQFSDHPIAVADLEVPTARPAAVLSTSLQPRPAPLNIPTTFIVSAVDSVSRIPVEGDVLIDGDKVATTNVSFSATLRQKRVRNFDPATRRWNVELVDPSLTVTAAGYPETSVDLGL
jgi:hypothetical protein